MYNYFSGWYFKCQSQQDTIAFIIATHQSKHQKNSSLQIITNDKTWNVNFPFEALQKKKDVFHLKIKNNILSDHGIEINLHTNDLSITGSVRFHSLSPLKYNIMGPFQYIPLMQCKHDVISMKHYVDGELKINNKQYIFNNSLGYIEGDRGYSFPKQYAWTQCFFDNNSLMFSVADIPFGLFHFTGTIGIILYNNKEYRFATYLGAKVVKKENNEIIIKQQDMIFKAQLIKKNALPLLAPTKGNMTRTIHESITCLAYYSFIIKNHTVFSFQSSYASFEYEY